MGTAISGGGQKAGPGATKGTRARVARSYNSHWNGLACAPVGIPRYSRLKLVSPRLARSCCKNSAVNTSTVSAVAFRRVQEASSFSQADQNGSMRLHAVHSIANRAPGQRARIGRKAEMRSSE